MQNVKNATIATIWGRSMWNSDKNNILPTEREPVRPCNFHTVIGGFVAHTGPFQLKWWLWFLYSPKMVLLVIVTPKNVSFGYYVGHMPHKFINQNQKNSKKTKKEQRNQKKAKKPKKNPQNWEHHYLGSDTRYLRGNTDSKHRKQVIQGKAHLRSPTHRNPTHTCMFNKKAQEGFSI